jgi:hypothetical protein
VTCTAHDLMVSEIIRAEFKKLGAKVISADGGVDLILDHDRSGQSKLLSPKAADNRPCKQWAVRNPLSPRQSVVRGKKARCVHRLDQ